MEWTEEAKRIFPNEWAQYVREYSIGGSRRPDSVTFSTIDIDVKRRDLTVNALFYDIQTKEIVDLVGGISDIRSGTVRTVGRPQDRFDEDQLRKLRAVRFKFKLKNGKLDKETYEALKADPDLSKVSPERIKDEFFKILESAQNVQDAIDLLVDLNFFQYIFPGKEIAQQNNCEQKEPVVTVALLLRNDKSGKLERWLTEDRKYTGPEASAINFLVKLVNLEESNAFQMKRLQGRSSLRSDSVRVEKFLMHFFPKEFAEKFANYHITTTGEEIEAKGFRGAEVGKEMERIETEKFVS